MKKQSITLSLAFNQKYWEKRNILLHLKNYNGGKEVNWSDCTRSFLVGWSKYIKQQTSPNTARQYNKLIASVLNDYSYEIELPYKNYKEVLRIKVVDAINIYLTNEEIKKLINYIPLNEREHTVKNQFLLSCLTGMRHSDVINLTESNIINGTIIYLAEKTNNAISVPSSKIVVELLKQHKTTVYYNTQFKRTIQSICQKIGINESAKTVRAGKHLIGKKWQFVNTHTARRSYATNLYLATKDLHLVSQLMGHTNTEQTQRYICTYPQDNKMLNSYFEQFNLAANQ